MMRDQDFGIVRVRAFGTYDFRIVDPQKFLKEVAGTDNHFRLDEFADTMRSRLVSVFSEALATSKVPVLDVATRYSELGDGAAAAHQSGRSTRSTASRCRASSSRTCRCRRRSKQAIDKRSSMAAVGNLNDYVKFQMAQGFAKGGPGVGGIGAEMAVGMAMAQQMMNQPGGIIAQTTPAGWRRAGGAAVRASRKRSVRPMRRRRSACRKPTSSPASKPAT